MASRRIVLPDQALRLVVTRTRAGATQISIAAELAVSRTVVRRIVAELRLPALSAAEGARASRLLNAGRKRWRHSIGGPMRAQLEKTSS